jgi:tetratricopeptide (TPR) repeat protein
MSAVVGVFGRGVTMDTTELLSQWLSEYQFANEDELTPELHKVINLLAARKLRQLEECLSVHLFTQPACILGRMASAALWVQNNDLDQAVSDLKCVTTLQPTNTMALYALGHCYERLKQESEATAYYQDCLKFKDYLQLPLQRLAAIYLKNGDFAKTIGLYEQLKGFDPDGLSTQLSLGHLYLATEQFDRAIDAFNTAILMHPDALMFQDVDLEQLLADQEYYDAIDYIEEQLSIYPNRSDLFARKADVLCMLGATSEAIEAYRQALQLCPTYLDVAVKLGTLYIKNNNPLSAADLFIQAMDINDQITDGYLGLAVAHWLNQSPNGATGALSSATMLLPNTMLLFSETTRLLVNALNHDPLGLDHSEAPVELLAIKAHEKHIQAQPSNPAPYYRLALLQLHTNGPEYASAFFQSALLLSPMFDRANTKLAMCLYSMGDTTSAFEKLVAQQRVDPESLQLHYETALMYCDQIKFASSLINMSRNIHDNFSEADAASQIGIILENLGVIDPAETIWEGLQETMLGMMSIN